MDREAEFGRLYEAHRAAVHAYFVGKVGDRQLAADLMQDVFLRAWQHLDTATVRVTDADAAAIFRRIIASPAGLAPAAEPVAPSPAAAPGLKPSWWRGYNAGFAARMVASTAPVRLAA